VSILGRFAVALGTGLLAAGLAAAAGLGGESIRTIEIDIRYSHFEPSMLTVPAGVPIRFVLINGDPIDHEWIVGDEAVHARHRTGTEPAHGARPTEQSVGAGHRIETIVTFAQPGVLTYVCHLPGHEAYGMVGTLTVIR
jgi:uncharacterized cupredoxin-like copper-binding protein